MRITEDLVLQFTEEEFAAASVDVLGDAQMLNQFLCEEMGKWPELHGTCRNEWLLVTTRNEPTHRVRLMPPQKIQPKECKHFEVQIYDLKMGNPAFRCLSCKKPVQPKNGWEVV